jgi:two-component system response regulator LytT
MSDKTVILIVDDEMHIINALKRVFHKMNYEILSTTMPKDAMDIMDNTKLDIVVCDYNMPIFNGIDVLKYAKKVQPDTIRILMTGYCDVNIAISAINEGSVFYYISKPWKNEEVISVINNALEEKRSRNEQIDLYRYINESQNYLVEMSNKLKSMDKENEFKNIKVSVLEDENILLINSEDILYLTASEGDVLIFTNGAQYRSRDTLNIWNDKLRKSRFFRCHRSYLVNLEKIEKISSWFNGTYNIQLKDCKENIPVSRGNMKELRELLGI